MGRISDRGIPIMSEHEKLVALAYCLARGHYEDVAGHLCDLLEHCRIRIHPSVGKPFASLREMVDYYGEHPTEIEEEPS